MNHHVSLPINDLFQVKTVCDDCGRRQVYGRKEVAREQARLGLATPEEFGSYCLCAYCKERGGDGKNITVRLITKAGIATDVPRDLRPLRSLNFVSGECPRCGHEAKLGPEKLEAFDARLTVHDLWCRATCEECKADGIPNPRMTIQIDPPYHSTSKPQTKVKWSTAEVFGDNRSSPFANLPASRLMRG